MSKRNQMETVARRAKEASFVTGNLSHGKRKAILRRMAGLGFRVIRFTRRFHGDVLFVNQDAGLGRLEYLFVRAVLRNARGLRRIAERAISTRSASH